MKAVQTRSPIHLAYEYANLNNVLVSIWVSDSPNIDSTTTPDYQLNSQAINDFASVEISELIRSKNDYIFNPDFYTRRDTVKFVLVKAVLLDDTQTQLEVKYDFLRVRDGYVRRINNVTDKELPQIYRNILPTNFNEWVLINTNLSQNILDPFGGNDAYTLDNSPDGAQVYPAFAIEIDDVVTVSLFAKSNNSTIEIGDSFGVCLFSVIEGTVISQGSNILATDIISLSNGYRRLSVVFIRLSGFLRIKGDAIDDSDITLFNPKITKGNLINFNATEVVLQDNYEVFSDGFAIPKIMFDRKNSGKGGYSFGSNNFIGSFFNQNPDLSYIADAQSETVILDQLDGTRTTQQITLNEINECKHTPTKVSFINRFGVIQDLVFFKKRTDNIDTDKESYKTNVLQQGNYYPHIGQTQTIRKESKRSVTLNSGFYPEEFNTVFEQLQNSLHYWIDDEPAVLEGSSFNVKTRVNDKLINYTFDFSYSNEEVNTI